MLYSHSQDNYFESLPQGGKTQCTEMTMLILVYKGRAWAFLTFLLTVWCLTMFQCSLLKGKVSSTSFLLMCPFRQETAQHSFCFTFKHCVGNCRTFSLADPSIVVNPLTVVQQNKNSNPDRMKEDSKTLRPGLVLSNGKSLRVVCLLTNLGFPAVEGERASSAALEIWMGLAVLQKFLSLH